MIVLLSSLTITSHLLHIHHEDMANSRFGYVRDFEEYEKLVPYSFTVVRIDGQSFHRFSDIHQFEKPNDKRALECMNSAARFVLEEIQDVILAFGESDEFSFLLRPQTTLYDRRKAKILTKVVSAFTSAFVYNWGRYFSTPLAYPPGFDGRTVTYPHPKHVRDYFAWRQVDTHINNLYNTTFWAIVQQGGKTEREAHKILQGTVSAEKHDILFKEYGINYNTLDDLYKKGSILVRIPPPMPEIPADGSYKDKKKIEKIRKDGIDGTRGPIEILHLDIIKDTFWNDRPWLLSQLD
ncbi:tRNAHis guanylyltransferase [Wallemia mellicola]|uniref:tRNA(His) guanylyltransferase n=1 Tax=Wallemia mellicola TaxID=1708541 RepID=A0A4T0NRB5_9BASI|nr:tRNAHis guanylyltransferase [Wallemia mellicola]TIC64853.1 tRNAHis guanylyltransferase [Wallemia mellicola]